MWYNWNMEEEQLVSASEIARHFGIPRSTVYALVKSGDIPAHDVTRSWHKRTHYGLRISEVAAALRKIRPS